MKEVEAIEYEDDGKHYECFTPCGYKEGIMVKSRACQKCNYYFGCNEREKIVYCCYKTNNK
jgi:hypothetical protein